MLMTHFGRHLAPLVITKQMICQHFEYEKELKQATSRNATQDHGTARITTRAHTKQPTRPQKGQMIVVGELVDRSMS